MRVLYDGMRTGKAGPMATNRRHPSSNIFYLDYRHPMDGKRKQKSHKTRDLKVAKAALRKFEAELILGNAQAVVPIALPEVLEDYRAYSQVHKAPRTCQADDTRISRFFARTCVRNLTDVTPRHIQAYQTFRLSEVTQATAARDVQTVRAFFKWALGQEYLAKDPCQNVKRLGPGKQSRAHFLSLDELDRLLKVAEKPIVLHGRGPKGTTGIKGQRYIRARRTPLVEMISIAAFT
ncbi:phage integrase N-terminal SAM-like domain-containing protein [bacterium AH-315-F18]|nr:phage integrase N-terminal SAM-like domain-containing protein [bacterium AH-315-F18]